VPFQKPTKKPETALISNTITNIKDSVNSDIFLALKQRAKKLAFLKKPYFQGFLGN